MRPLLCGLFKLVLQHQHILHATATTAMLSPLTTTTTTTTFNRSYRLCTSRPLDIINSRLNTHHCLLPTYCRVVHLVGTSGRNKSSLSAVTLQTRIQVHVAKATQSIRTSPDNRHTPVFRSPSSSKGVQLSLCPVSSWWHVPWGKNSHCCCRRKNCPGRTYHGLSRTHMVYDTTHP